MVATLVGNMAKERKSRPKSQSLDAAVRFRIHWEGVAVLQAVPQILCDAARPKLVDLKVMIVFSYEALAPSM
jgi:hypothetical protein